MIQPTIAKEYEIPGSKLGDFIKSLIAQANKGVYFLSEQNRSLVVLGLGINKGRVTLDKKLAELTGSKFIVFDHENDPFLHQHYEDWKDIGKEYGKEHHC